MASAAIDFEDGLQSDGLICARPYRDRRCGATRPRSPVGEPVAFDLPVTLAVPGELALYDEVYARLRSVIRAAARC